MGIGLNFGNHNSALPGYGVEQIGAPVLFEDRRIAQLVYPPVLSAAQNSRYIQQRSS
jgi:hypothetical protein